jgi:Fur family ferric uptake transcriptional regulator
MAKGSEKELETEAIRLLGATKLRRTRGRIQLLKALLRERKPMSHADIMRRLEGERFDRVSVYRCLSKFLEAGLVHKAYISDRNDMFELADRCGEDYCHPHFSCTVCKETTCLTDVSVPVMRNLGKGFVASRQKIYIEGVCPRCSGK